MATNKKTDEQATHVEDQKVAEAVANNEPVLAAPVMNINTANGAGNRVSEAELQREIDDVAKILGKMPKKSISIPKQLASVVGETMVSCINGACIHVPVDGETYEIPEAYYTIIMDSLKVVNSGDVRPNLAYGITPDNPYVK